MCSHAYTHNIYTTCAVMHIHTHTCRHLHKFIHNIHTNTHTHIIIRNYINIHAHIIMSYQCF